MATVFVDSIPAFNDNYIWALRNPAPAFSSECCIVDPGDGNVVLNYLSESELELKTILVTHHHPDHVGGIKLLKSHFPSCEVIASSSSRFKEYDRSVESNDSVMIQGIEFKVISVPGHTLDHIAYYADAQQTSAKPILFCGDTLFSGGCGRLFEGTPAQMLSSLNELAALPTETQVYCAHEYTLSNLKFAEQVEPTNQALRAYYDNCKQLRSEGRSTIPTSIGIEKDINPFLRVNSAEVIEFARTRHSIEKTDISPEAIFAAVRQAKDQF